MLEAWAQMRLRDSRVNAAPRVRVSPVPSCCLVLSALVDMPY